MKSLIGILACCFVFVAGAQAPYVVSKNGKATNMTAQFGFTVAKPGLTNLVVPPESELSSNVVVRVDNLYDTNHLTVTGSSGSGVNGLYTMKLPLAGCRVWTNTAGTWGICERDVGGCGGSFSLTNSAGVEWSGFFLTVITDLQSHLPLQCSPTSWKLFDGLDCINNDGTMCVTATQTGTLNVTTKTNISATAFSANGIISMLESTHVGATLSWQSKGGVYPLFYATNGEGMVRSIEFTSYSLNSELDNRTNVSLRVYADAGSVNLAGSGVNLPAANIVADIPLYSLMCAKYWASFRTNYVGPLAFGTRYVGWVEVSSNVSQFAISHYTITVRYPMPYTNGLVIILFDSNTGLSVPSGFSYVGYETGTVPEPLRNVRLRSYHTVTTLGSATDIPILVWPNGGGEVCSLFVTARHPNGDNSFWEGVWYQTADHGFKTAFACAGGEDMFNNGYYLDGGANSTFDWGTRYIHKAGTEDYISESYRHFYGADTHHWLAYQNIYFQVIQAANGLNWDSLAIFYGRQ